MADETFVINVGGYIGSSTRSEIEYDLAAGKDVRDLEPMPAHRSVLGISEGKSMKKKLELIIERA